MNKQNLLKEFLQTIKETQQCGFKQYDCPVCTASKGLHVVKHQKYINGTCDVCDEICILDMEGNQNANDGQ